MATLLVITVLLPLLGSLVLVLTPRLDRNAARSIALGCTLATLGFSLILLLGVQDRRPEPPVRLRARGGPLRPELDLPARHPFRSGSGRTEPLALPAHGPADEHGGLLVVGGDHRPGPALLRLPAGARDRAAGALRQPGRGALLHLLRVHADSPVLPDRTLGRARPPAGVDHVLPVHAGGQPAHLAGRDRAGGRARPVLSRARAHLLDSRADAGTGHPALAEVARGGVVVEPPGR